MTDLEQVVKAVETGLLSANCLKGRPQQRMNLRERMARYRVPGFSIALIEKGEIVWARGYGVLEVGGDEPVTSETLFQAASISKPVAAMAALYLVEAGLLDLDDDVNQVLRSWRIPENEHTQKHKVTLRGLLSHTAGLNVSGFRGYAAGADVPTLRQVLDGEPPANSDPIRVTQDPGKAFSYSGGGYTVVQQLLEDLTDRPFAELVQELVFDKLGMANSTFAQPLPEATSARAATAHRNNGQQVQGRWHTYPELAAAGLWTTPAELARFVVEILRSEAGESNAVLSPEMTREMLTPQLPSWVGLGLPILEMKGLTRFQHPGWNEGYHSFMCGYIGTGQGVVWMTNSEYGELLGQEVMRGLAWVYGWPGFEPRAQAVARIDPDVYARYAGNYQLVEEPDWSAVVFQRGDRLFWQDALDGLRYELYPATETVFFALEHPEAITFIEGVDSRIEAATVGEYVRLERVD